MCTGVKPAKLPRASSRPSDKIFDMTEVKNWFFAARDSSQSFFQHGILSILVVLFFSTCYVRIILSESYQTKRNRQGIFKGKNRPPTHRFIFPSTVAVPCLSMLKASKNPRKYRPVLRTQGNQSLLFELFVLSGCCWLLFLDFVVVSCLVFGLAILLHYVLLACWVEASKDAKDGKKTLPNYVPSQPWFLLTAKLSSNPILGSSSQTWRRIKNPQKTGFQQKTKLHPFIDLKGNHPSPAYNCSPQPSSSAWSQAPDFVQHKAWIKWSVQHKLPEP